MGQLFFLVTTSHLKDRLLFRDESDFRVGMNLVAAACAKTGVVVLAFILMSNHTHFVLECTEEEAAGFINNFKHRYGRYFRNKYSFKEVLRKNAIDIKPVESINESLERAIAYVQMNCVAAKICSHPSQYSWGSGNIFFSASSPDGKSLAGMSFRAQFKILHTGSKLPGKFLLSNSGYILPESYVAKDFVESLFRSPDRYNYFLHSSSKAKKRLEPKEGGIPAFRDQLILAAIPDLCMSLFDRRMLKDLSAEQTAEVIKQIQRRFVADPAQISRVTGIPHAQVSAFLDSF